MVEYCNGADTFIPPISIFKEKNLKDEYEHGTPTGSKIYMNKKSASYLFLRWLKMHFTPRKPKGTV